MTAITPRRKLLASLLSVRRRISILDLLTVAMFAVAVGLLVRPGSSLRTDFANWRARSALEAAAERQWDALVARAVPLYSGGGLPEVIEFSDYQCPFCRAASASVDSAVAGGVRIGMVHLPLAIHSHARLAALLVICATELHDFRGAHDVLMTTTWWQSDTTPDLLARRLDPADASKLSACASSARASRALDQDLALADSLHVPGTPLFVARRRVLTTAPTRANLIALAKRR